MMGYCHECRADTATDPKHPRPTCAVCGYPSTPPTWGRRTQRWTGADWEPAIPKPEGYRWIPPELRAQEIKAAKVQVCAHCGMTFTPKSLVPTIYCTAQCKDRAYRARRREGAA